MMKICIKIFGINFGNSILDKSKWDKISEGLAKNRYLEQTEALFERGNCKPNPLIQTVVHRPILYDSIIYQKGIYNFLWNRKKYDLPPRRLVQLSDSTSGPGILDIETQINSLKIKWIQRLLNPNNALWKHLMLYQLNLILNYIQGLVLSRQKQILGSNSHIYKNRAMKISLFSYSMLGYILPFFTWLHNSNSPAPTSVKEILNQPIFLNLQSKLRPYFL